MKTWEEMTDEEQGELLLAYHRGEAIEFFGGLRWYVDKPYWNPRVQYRIKPKEVTHTVTQWCSPHGRSECASLLYGHIDGAVKGTTTITYINDKPKKLTWEADE